MEPVMSHAPAAKPPAMAPLHERDLYAWSQEQARLLLAGRLDEIDAENIAEEVLGVGRAEYRILESALRVLLTHMLKWDYQVDKRSRSWKATIAIQRRHALRQLEENPSLKARRDEAVENAYRDARKSAFSETGIRLETFPEACPYNWDAISQRLFGEE